MLGICGEYIVENTNTVDDIVDKIKEYELSLGMNNALSHSFVIKKIGIKSNSDCTIKLNGNRLFNLKKNEPLEFAYNVFYVTSLIAQTQGVKLIIRYLY
jgi:hypothetical protein